MGQNIEAKRWRQLLRCPRGDRSIALHVSDKSVVRMKYTSRSLSLCQVCDHVASKSAFCSALWLSRSSGLPMLSVARQQVSQSLGRDDVAWRCVPSSNLSTYPCHARVAILRSYMSGPCINFESSWVPSHIIDVMSPCFPTLLSYLDEFFYLCNNTMWAVNSTNQ